MKSMKMRVISAGLIASMAMGLGAVGVAATTIPETAAETIVISADEVIDLGNKTFTSTADVAFVIMDGATVTISNGTINAESYGIIVCDGATLTLNDVTLTADSYGVYVRSHDLKETAFTGDWFTSGDWDNNVSNKASLTVNDSDITAGGYAITGNGYDKNPGSTEIVIKSGNISGNHGIYHPQGGTLTIEDGTITGANTGIEMRGGSLEVNGGVIESTYTGTPEVTANGSGSTTVGAAIAVSQHSTNVSINVEITAGTLKGEASIFEQDVQNPSSGESTTITVNGEYACLDGDVVSNTTSETETVTINIVKAQINKDSNITIARPENATISNSGLKEVTEFTYPEKSTPNFFLFMFMKRLLTEYAVELVYDETMGIVEIDDEDGFVRFSTDVEITVAALEGYEVESVLVNGEAVELDEDGAYTIKRIRKDAKVEVTFAEIVEDAE